MIAAVPTAVIVSLHLKPPDVVTKVNPRDEFGLGEFGEVAVNGGTVKAAMIERLRHLGMCLGPQGREHVLQHGQAGGCTP